MTITSHGPICDVGGEYILMPALGIGEMHSFSMTVFPGRSLHCCDDHLPAIKAASEVNDWHGLPNGPIRKAFEDASARQEGEPQS